MNRRPRLLHLLLPALLAMTPVAVAAQARAAGSAAPPLPVGDLLAGEFARQQGDYATAARHYMLAALASGDPAVAARATEVALAAGLDGLADRALARWRQLEPESLYLHAAAVALALRQGEHETAMEEALPMLAVGDGPGWPLLLEALSAARGDDAVIARSVVAELHAQARVPDRLQAWLQLAGLARRLHDEALSRRIEATALARFPDDPRGRVLQAARLRQEGRIDGARQHLLPLLAMPPLPPDLRATAARELALLGEPSAGAALLARGPQDDASYAERGRWLILGADHAGLQALYGEIQREPGPPASPRRLLLGHLAEAQGRLDEAEAWYAGVDGDGRELATSRRARVLARQERLPEALALLDALQQDRDADGEQVRDSFLLEAELLQRAGRRGEALVALDEALETFEGDPVLLYARGLARERAGRIDDALADFRTIIDEDPGHAHALNAYGYALATHRADFAGAHPYLEQAHRLAPASSAIQDSLGWVRFRLGRVEEGLALLRQAWQAGPDPEVAAHLGEALWVTGDHDGARAVWAAGLAADPGNDVLAATMKAHDR